MKPKGKAGKGARRERRRFSSEFKAEAVRQGRLRCGLDGSWTRLRYGSGTRQQGLPQTRVRAPRITNGAATLSHPVALTARRPERRSKYHASGRSFALFCGA
jgi:hypothetical protein